MVVLFPDADLREAQLAQRLTQMAAHGLARGQVGILLVAMARDWADESAVRLRLALLKALLRDTELPVDIELRSEMAWVDLARSLYQPGDLLVCFSEHELPDHIDSSGVSVRNNRLGRHLMAHHFAVTELSGYVIASAEPQMWRDRLKGWLVPIAIILVMLIFQIALVQWTRSWNDWAQKFTLVISVLLEIAAVARLSV